MRRPLVRRPLVRRGVSLVEVLLALVLLALFFVPLLSSARQSRNEVADAAQMLLALDAPDGKAVASRAASNPVESRAGSRLLVRDVEQVDPLSGVAPVLTSEAQP